MLEPANPFHLGTAVKIERCYVRASKIMHCVEADVETFRICLCLRCTLLVVNVAWFMLYVCGVYEASCSVL